MNALHGDERSDPLDPLGGGGGTCVMRLIGSGGPSGASWRPPSFGGFFSSPMPPPLLLLSTDHPPLLFISPSSPSSGLFSRSSNCAQNIQQRRSSFQNISVIAFSRHHTSVRHISPASRSDRKRSEPRHFLRPEFAADWSPPGPLLPTLLPTWIQIRFRLFLLSLNVTGSQRTTGIMADVSATRLYLGNLPRNGEHQATGPDPVSSTRLSG